MELIELKEPEMRGRKPELAVPDNFAIAGGSVRRWFTGEKQDSDIDLFRIDGKEEYDVELKGWSKGNSTLMADNYFKNRQQVQVIKRAYKSIEAMFENFDFHHCQFAYTNDGKIYSTKKGVICALRKHLSFNNIEEEFELDTLRRAFKYQRQGYTPCAGTIGRLAKALRESDSDFDEQMKMSAAGGTIDIIPFD